MMIKKECLLAIKKYNENECDERISQYRQNYKLSWSQALDDNFDKYDRGHLNPAGHHGKGDSSKATMTFTNVAPQIPKMNQVQWNQYEKKLKEDLSGGCSEMYVVTGVVPMATRG
ncbi:hypothetical protein DPEC_G00184730 [Dallia pectoralis]|uniref:Uncharacterized protein n=1 Tax=Dallia pectoralis TaxID=75939 RepID=A0ACC2GB41_DALPE|nr:hypothetical protein DPEC_G00184730 [Dallia pectoralis]